MYDVKDDEIKESTKLYSELIAYPLDTIQN